MRLQNRWWTLSLAIGAIAALLILSAGLNSMQFSYGEFVRLPRDSGGDAPTALPSTGGDLLGNMLLIFLAIAQLLLPFAIIYFLLSKEARKRVLRSLASLMWLIALFILIRRRADLFDRSDVEIPFLGGEAQETLPGVELNTQPSDAFVLAVSIVLALIVTIGLFAVAWMYWQRRAQEPSSLDRLADEAQEALEALDHGAELRNTIMRCYYDMARILRQERNLEREQAMTPREFERRLIANGVPSSAVRELTRLFEIVRYSSKELGEQQEQQANASLRAIIAAVRG